MHAAVEILKATPNLVPYAERWAPPFNAAPYPFTRYQFPSGSGGWTAVSIDWNGNIVAQLGAQPATPNPPLTSCSLVAGYNRDFKIPTGRHDWVASLQMGPVSESPRGGTAEVYAYIQARGPNFNLIDLQRVHSRESRSLLVGSSQVGGAELRGGDCNLRVGFFLLISYQGSQLPYTEGIGTVTNLTHYGPPSTAQALNRRAASADRLALFEDLQAKLLGEPILAGAAVQDAEAVWVS